MGADHSCYFGRPLSERYCHYVSDQDGSCCDQRRREDGLHRADECFPSARSVDHKKHRCSRRRRSCKGATISDAGPDICRRGRQAAQAAGRRLAGTNRTRRGAAEQAPVCLPATGRSRCLRSAAEQKEFYNQQVAQYKAQINSFDAKINQTQATIQKYEADASRYQQREQIAKQIEDMRATLAAHGTGSQYNLLTSQDQRVDMLRTLEYDHNSLVEVAAYFGFYHGRPGRIYSAVVHATKPRSCDGARHT